MRDWLNEKYKLTLGGLPQLVRIWGTDPSNRVILFLHGGPGYPNRHTIRAKHLDLIDDFTLVAWDQRGTGGSYAGCDPETLSLDRMIEDAAELVEHLCTVFEKDRIFLLGGSWGTELGTFLASRHPEHIAGYIGYGQVVNGIRNEEISFTYALEQVRHAGDEKSVNELLSVGPPQNGQYHPVYKGLLTQRRIMAKYGGHAMGKENYLLDTALPILTSPEYGVRETWGILKGGESSITHLWPSIVHYDFLADMHEFAMPYFIFQGRHDFNTPSELLQPFYDAIVAPDKDLVWFEHSAHGPLNEEPVRFKKLLREKFMYIDG